MQPDAILDNALQLGDLSGTYRALGAVANRCSAADADTLIEIRDGKLYKNFGLTWKQYCRQKLGISRTYADRLIQCRQEFGETYFRLAQLVPMSPATYRLLQDSVSPAGIDLQGQLIPLKPEFRRQIAEAIEARCANRRKLRARPGLPQIRRRIQSLMNELSQVEVEPSERDSWITLVVKTASDFMAMEVALESHNRLM